MMKDLSIKAIIIGLLVDIGGTFAFSFVVGIISVAVFLATGRDVKELEAIATTQGFLIPSLIAGLLFTSLGGFVAAHIAKKAEMKNAFVLGILSLAFGLGTTVLMPDPATGWYDITGVLLIIPFALLGGYLRLKAKIESQLKQRT